MYKRQGLRCGELIGLTWKDINIKAKTVNVDHQLIYKNLGDGCKFHISTPKTESGIRIIPMTQEVAKAFEEQRKINFMLAKDKSIEVDGYSGFVFTAKSGRPLMPNGVNSVLYNIVDAYNKTEVELSLIHIWSLCIGRFSVLPLLLRQFQETPAPSKAGKNGVGK